MKSIADYKKGSLIIHGYKSDEDVAEYKCMLHYVDQAAWLSEKQKSETKEETKEETKKETEEETKKERNDRFSKRQILLTDTRTGQPKNMTAFHKNITVTWFNVKRELSLKFKPCRLYYQYHYH